MSGQHSRLAAALLRTPEAARFLGLSGRSLRSIARTAPARHIASWAGASSTPSTTCRPGPIAAPSPPPPIRAARSSRQAP